MTDEQRARELLGLYDKGVHDWRAVASALATARAEALEEAAKMCDEWAERCAMQDQLDPVVKSIIVNENLMRAVAIRALARPTTR